MKLDKLFLIKRIIYNRSTLPTRPIHTMWTFPGATSMHINNSSRCSSLSDLEVLSDPVIKRDQAQHTKEQRYSKLDSYYFIKFRKVFKIQKKR